jgi:hypothetical protein
MLSRTIEDAFSKGSVNISEDDTQFDCSTLFNGEMPPVLAVLGSDGTYKGVLARRWIIRSKPDPARTKVKKLMRAKRLI